MNEYSQTFFHRDYTVGWICALPKPELVAAMAMLDEKHPVLPAADPQNDSNTYILGRIGDHNVVIACLSAETTNKVSAATVAKDMIRSFPNVRFGLMVGIGGGAPFYGARDGTFTSTRERKESSEDSEDSEDDKDTRDIRLGDVVVSLHSKSADAVIQYDFGKSLQKNKFISNGGKLNRPPSIVLGAVAYLEAQHVLRHKISETLSNKISSYPALATYFQYPGSKNDCLFKSTIVHKEGKISCRDCRGASDKNLVKRKDRSDNLPVLHYGTIGSADKLMEDAILRDKWAREENIICFEIEAAGLMDSFPCLVIRGICDYADSHKNNIWQPYAAATAASYAKELLQVISKQGVMKMDPIEQIQRSVHDADKDTSSAIQTLSIDRRHNKVMGKLPSTKGSSLHASGAKQDTTKLWDSQTGTELRILEGHSNLIYSVAFSSDSHRIVSGSIDETIKLWDTQTGTELRTLKGHSGSIESVAFSPDSYKIVSGSANETIKLWDAQTGIELQTLKGHSGSVGSVAFSPDGHMIVSGSADETIKLWDAQTGTELLTLEGHSAAVCSVAFSPDGHMIVSGSADKTIKLWDVQAGTELLTLEGHSAAVYSVAFSPDGHIIVSGSADETIKLWNIQTGTELLTFEGHSDSIYSVAFLPDGRRIISGSLNNTIKLWDIQTGSALQTLKGHYFWAVSVAFSPDGQKIISSSLDNTIELWDTNTGSNYTRIELPSKAERGPTSRSELLDKSVELQQENKSLPRRSTRHSPLWLKRLLRPKLKAGFRRIEWQCDCGVHLHADFPPGESEAIDDLACSLQNDGEPRTDIRDSHGNNTIPSSHPSEDTSDENPQSKINAAQHFSQQSTTRSLRPKFLALCINTGFIYKTLLEIDTSGITSDATAFLRMKEGYLRTRRLASHLNFLLKPVTIEFVQFTLWNLRAGYISIYDRPDCIPPDSRSDYEFIPRPLEPPIPMPPEVFIHYLGHNDGDLSYVRKNWLDRLPKRVGRRVVDGDEGTYGWGIHIIEGPNRELIFWIIMVTIFGSLLASILWAALHEDIQGGTGLGTLIVALPPVILTAFLFRIGAV